MREGLMAAGRAYRAAIFGNDFNGATEAAHRIVALDPTPEERRELSEATDLWIPSAGALCRECGSTVSDTHYFTCSRMVLHVPGDDYEIGDLWWTGAPEAARSHRIIRFGTYTHPTLGTRRTMVCDTGYEITRDASYALRRPEWPPKALAKFEAHQAAADAARNGEKTA